MSNGKTDTQQIISIENVRLSYLYAFEPYRGTDQSGKETRTFTVHAILTPADQANIAKVKAAQRAAAIALWGAGGEQMLQQLAAQDRVCLHSGDRNKPGEEAYAGNLFVSANNKTKPRICVTRGGVNVDIQSDDQCAPYSGCYGNLLVGIWAQSNKFGKRINAAFMGIQFLRHAERLGGSRIAKLDEFGIAAPEADGAVPLAAPVAAAGASPGSDLA